MAVVISTEVTREQKINSILLHKHGAGSKLARALAELSFKPGSPQKEPSPQLLAAEAELEALSEEQLDAQYREVLKQSAAVAAARVAREEAERPFNGPKAKADFAHWAKCAYWTIEEAIALALGREPKIANPEIIRTYLQISEFARLYERTLDLANRSVGWQQLTKPVPPGTFIAWAKRYEVPVSPELEAEVAKYGHFIGDWKTLYDRVKQQLDEARQREREASDLIAKLNGDMNTLAGQVQAAVLSRSAAKSTKGVDPREAESLRKLCIGMAVAGYGYDPQAARSDKISDIVGDLERLDIALDADTVRKHLKMGADLLPPEALPKREK
jgi:hypothetical protein